MSQEEAINQVSWIFSLLKAQGDGAYIGESISQLEHCLQAAHFAEESGADNQTIIAALLHDIGQFLPLETMNQDLEMADGKGGSVGRKGHDKLGEDWLRKKGWPEKVCTLVGAHVIAKRYLTATSPTYLESLSSASRTSLKHQGGPFSKEEIEEFHKDPLWQSKITLRTWDDRSKVVGMKTKSLEEYQPMAIEILQSSLRA